MQTGTRERAFAFTCPDSGVGLAWRFAPSRGGPTPTTHGRGRLASQKDYNALLKKVDTGVEKPIRVGGGKTSIIPELTQQKTKNKKAPRNNSLSRFSPLRLHAGVTLFSFSSFSPSPSVPLPPSPRQTLYSSE